MSMRVTFWGTRGGVPVSGPEFVEYGGATTCLELAFPPGEPERPDRILIDCGTGIVQLGQHLDEALHEALILQTHMHWDHIQGFPFFNPFYDPEASFSLWGVDREGCALADVYQRQMCEPAFPVRIDQIQADLEFRSIDETGGARIGDVDIEWTEMQHPSGSTAYRFERDGAVFVFSGDVEVRKGCRDRLIDFARGADVFVMDAQYFPDEYEARRGFGHSTFGDAVRVAQEAGVGELYLTHHDPGHYDQTLDEKAKAAVELADDDLVVANARDQMTVDIP